MKIVLIGAGSYVFGPTVLWDVLVKHRMVGELVLVDVNLAVAEAMAGVGRRMADDLEVKCTVTATDTRQDVLADATFVILSAAPEGQRRWWIDYAILKEHGLPDQARECAGLGGLSYALRTISMALDLCEDMSALCPRAVLLDVTNPMPRIVSAVNSFTDIRAYGFCNVAYGGANGYEWLANLTGYTPANLNVVTAGLNHFSWLVSIADASTNVNLYSTVTQAVKSSSANDFAILQEYLTTYGAVGVSGPSHMAEFLPFHPLAHYASQPPYHGDAEERETRLRTLRDISDGRLEWRQVLTGGSWEHPVDVAVALDSGQKLIVDMINLPNAGYLPEIPDGRIVEVPAVVEEGVLRGLCVGELPGTVGQVCRQISDVHALVAEGAVTGNRTYLEQAIVVDPAITDKGKAIQVLDQLIEAHHAVLPRFRLV